MISLPAQMETSYPYGRVPGSAQAAMTRAAALLGLKGKEEEGYYAKYRYREQEEQGLRCS